jgi:hypothetical protein
MSAMRPTRCQDGLIEIVNAKEICTTETIVTVGYSDYVRQPLC